MKLVLIKNPVIKRFGMELIDTNSWYIKPEMNYSEQLSNQIRYTKLNKKGEEYFKNVDYYYLDIENNIYLELNEKTEIKEIYKKGIFSKGLYEKNDFDIFQDDSIYTCDFVLVK